MVDMSPKRILFSSVNAVDIVHAIAETNGDKSLVERRATGSLWSDIISWSGSRSDVRHEASEFRRRYDEVVPRGGKEIWTAEFMDEHSGLYLDGFLAPYAWFSDRSTEGDFDVLGTSTRLSREGVLTFRFDFELRPSPSSDSAIRLLSDLAKRAKEVSVRLITENLPGLGGLFTTDTDDIRWSSVRVAQYALTAVEGFYRDGEEVGMNDVLRSPELGGLINQSPWFKSYGEKHSALVASREIGYREDELYVVDRTSIVIVTRRFWDAGDSLVAYRFDLLLLAEHYLSRLVCLRGLGRELLRESTDGDRLQALQRVLNARRVIDIIDNSLSLAEMISQGFARRLGRALGDEIGLPDARRIAESRCDATLDNLALRDAIETARTSTSLAAQSADLANRNNWLQVTAITIAVLALVVTVIFGVLTSM